MSAAVQPTTEQIAAYLGCIRAMIDAVRDAGRIPSGHMYAVLMGHMTLHQYETLVQKVVSTGLVRLDGDELVWVG
jgi:hypothetical protein